MFDSKCTEAPVSVVVIGSGYWGKNLVRNFHAIGGLAGVCDSDTSILDRVAKQYPGCRVFTSVAEVLGSQEVKAVAIASPAEAHETMVKAALLAGKDVFVEKPLALSTAAGEELVALAQAQNRILMVGHLLWYHPAVLKLQELVASGELGRIQYIYSNRLNIGKIRAEENILWSFAPHDVSVILGLLGEMPDSVQSHGGNYLNPKIADVTVSMLSFPSGVKAHIFVSWLHPFKEQKLIVVGDKKMAVFDDMEKDAKLVVYSHTIGWENRIPVANKAEGQVIKIGTEEPLKTECQHFLDSIKSRQRPRTDGPEGLRVLQVLQQCQEAIGCIKPAVKPATAAKSYFAHQSAFIDDGVEIGEGSSIWHVSHILKGSRLGKKCKIGQNVVVGPNVTIGNGVKIQNNVSVYEGVTLEDNVFCGPSMVFTNVFNPRSEVVRMNELRKTLAREGATFGANCTILCGTTIGRYAFVGAGSMVTRDVPDFALVTGSPAKVRGWMCRCGMKLSWKGDSAACECGKHAYAKVGVVVVEAEAAVIK